MHKLIDYSSNYSETTGKLWFYLKNEVTNFITNIENIDDFKPFKYKTKLIGNTVVEVANGIIKNATSTLLLKYLNNSWRSLEMPLINYKVELKL